VVSGIVIIYIGRFLVLETKTQHADVAVVFLGGDNRYIHAAQLFHRGIIKKIIINNVFAPNKKKSRKYSTIFPLGTTPVIVRLLELKVPESSVIIIGSTSVNTADEAYAFVQYLNQNPHIQSITVVSNSYHMRRIKLTLGYFLRKEGLNVEIAYMPVPKDTFRPIGWWKRKYDRELVYSEYMKMINFLLLDRHKDREKTNFNTP
jgi:uncharacterized SAM-binding protein YcdF (DUF218 family)